MVTDLCQSLQKSCIFGGSDKGVASILEGPSNIGLSYGHVVSSGTYMKSFDKFRCLVIYSA